MTIDGPPDWAITMFVKSVFFMGDSIAQRGIGRVARVATCWSCMYALLARYVRPLSAWRAKYPRRPRRGTSERSRGSATFPRDGVREGRACRDRFLRIGA